MTEEQILKKEQLIVTLSASLEEKNDPYLPLFEILTKISVMGERLLTRIGRVVDEWVQRRLTPNEERERLEVDLSRQRFDYGAIVKSDDKGESPQYIPHGIDGPDFLSIMQLDLFKKGKVEMAENDPASKKTI